MVTQALDLSLGRNVRATTTGFLTTQGGTVDMCELWSIAFDGTATKVGDFSDPPAGTNPQFCIGRIDPDGNLWSVYGSTSGSLGVVVKRVIKPGTSTVEYDSNTAPAANFMTWPPVAWAVADSSFSQLITGP